MHINIKNERELSFASQPVHQTKKHLRARAVHVMGRHSHVQVGGGMGVVSFLWGAQNGIGVGCSRACARTVIIGGRG